MKKLIIIIFIVFLSVLAFFQIVDARSGCCSHHGGVCTYKCPGGTGVGYMCCDGSSLSATCDPYYPDCPPIRPSCGDGSCNGTENCSSCPRDCGSCPAPQIPPKSNTTNVNLPASKDSGVVAGANTEKESSNWVWWIIGLVGVGIIAYKIGKRKSNK